MPSVHNISLRATEFSVRATDILDVAESILKTGEAVFSLVEGLEGDDSVFSFTSQFKRTLLNSVHASVCVYLL